MLQTDGFEIVKRALHHVRNNRMLWPLAFFIALAGGGAQGFSLWVQSPIASGLTGYSPIHRIGQRITSFAHGHVLFWIVFVVLGIVVGLAVLAFGAFAQASAIGAVAGLECGREENLRDAFRFGRQRFPRYFIMVVAYLLILAVVALPADILTWATRGKGHLVLPCLGGIVLGFGFLAVSVFVAMMLELAGRYLVLEGAEIVESVRLAWDLFREYWRDVLLTWLYVMLILLAGTIVMAIVMTILATPLVWIFNAANTHHNAFLIAASILAFLLAWAVAAAAAGIFAITGSAVWTIAFLELEPGAARVAGYTR